MPPESFQVGKESEIHISTKMDIWSTGCLISEIFSGVVPWVNKVKNEISLKAKLFKKDEFPIPEEKITFVWIIDVIKKCLAINPNDRISAEELKKIIEEKMNSL